MGKKENSEPIVSKDDIKVTIVTPTYNRAPLLKVCFSSLLRQTCKAFVWLIVDDGSSDNTEETVSYFKENSDFVIQYVKKENGGKHTAINYSIRLIETELTLIVDSDDYLTDDAVESVVNTLKRFKDEENICGYTFLKQYPDGRIMGDIFPQEGRYNYIPYRVNGLVTGEQCDLFYTKILADYPFSEYPNEKFIGESTAWIKMAERYDMIAINKPIYIADYLEDGLTEKGKKFRLTCPFGGMEYTNLCMKKGCSLRRIIKSAVLFNVYSFAAGLSYLRIKENCERPNVVFALRPLAYMLYQYWRNGMK